MNIQNLPESILIIIFEQFPEAKQLMNLYLLSKTFASIVAQVSKIDIILTDRVSDCPDHHQARSPGNNFSHRYFTFLIHKNSSEHFHHMINTSRIDRSSTLQNQSRLPPCEAARFLSKFRETKTLYVEVPAIIHDLDNKTFLRWEAYFLEDSAYVIKFMAKSVRAENEARPEGLYVDWGYMDLTRQCLMDALWRHHIISHITKNNHDALIVCSDSMRQGKVFLQRGSMNDQKTHEHESFDLQSFPVGLNMRLSFTVFYNPKLKLPRSKLVFDGAIIAIERYFNAVSNEEIMNNSFVEDDVLKEAMGEICREGISGTVKYVGEQDLLKKMVFRRLFGDYYLVDSKV